MSSCAEIRPLGAENQNTETSRSFYDLVNINNKALYNIDPDAATTSTGARLTRTV